jgi:cytosine/adenosine deaminase-related metal-dependent hydrolase
MATVYRAPWVLPIAQPPIRDGWVVVQDGLIIGVGAGPAPLPTNAEFVQVDGAILPGLINAHTHLEFSYLRGQIPPAARFGNWVRAVLENRGRYADPADPAIVVPAREAIVEAIDSGTALLGDVSNTLVTVPLLRERGVCAQVFYELTGFTEPNPEERVREARVRVNAAASGSVRVSVAPHAPYSVSESLLRAIRADIDAHPTAVSTVHLGEMREEVELLRDGSGDIRKVLEELGRWPNDWRPPGVGPVEYLASIGVLDSRILAVHGVQFNRDDLQRLRQLGVTVVSCPRSNTHVGVGSPPLEAFYTAGVDVAFGTDSLASVADLNMFSELQEARRIAPSISARRLLESAVRTGARALGFGDELGAIEVGKRAALIAVSIPADVMDVEEYLLTGIGPHDIRWLGACA